MSTYFDTGVLVKIYCREPDSPAAIALAQGAVAALPLTHFQESELRNALRLKVFRKEVSAGEMREALANLDRDISEGRCVRPGYSISHVFQRAETLSLHHTVQTGARILDILHVAAAIEIGATKFVSFDQRQRAVAKKAKLKVIP